MALSGCHQCVELYQRFATLFEALWAATPTPGRRAHVRKASKFYFHALRGSGSATFRSTTGSGGTRLHLHLEFTSPGATIEFARVLDVEYRPGGLGAKPQNGSPTKPAPCPIESGQPRLAAPTHRSRRRGARRPWKISGVLLHSSAHKTYRRPRRVAPTRFNNADRGACGVLSVSCVFSKLKTYAATQARTQSTTRTHWSPSTGFTRCARARPGPMPAAPMATRSPI